MNNSNPLHPWRKFLLYTPVLLAVLVMLPRLVSSDFGLFDDGRSLLVAQKLADGQWDMDWDTQAGRYRPLYWLYFALPYLAFGARPLGFFVVNLLVLMGTTAALIAFVRAAGGSRGQAWWAGMLFVLSGPVIENFYTLSKGEGLQTLLLVLSLLAVMLAKRSGRAWQVLALLLALLGLLFSHLTKEISLVMLPISLAWLGLSWLRRRQSNSWNLQTAGIYALANLLAAGIYLLLRTAFVSFNLMGGSYTSNYDFQLGGIVASVVRWAGWLMQDFTFVLPLLLLALVVCGVQRKVIAGVMWLEMSLWMAAWMAIYLPWVYMAGYYMLPFAAGLAVFASALLEPIMVGLSAPSRWLRWATLASLLLTSLLFVLTWGNNLSTGRIQVAVDAANADVLEYVVENAPTDSTLWVNIQLANEYVEMLGYYLQFWDRPDVRVDVFSAEIASVPGDLLIDPRVKNQPLLIARMGVVEPTQQEWNASLQAYLQSGDWQSQTSFDESVDLMMFNPPRLLCPFMQERGFCMTDAPLFDRRLFSYGWEVYQLEKP